MSFQYTPAEQEHLRHQLEAAFMWADPHYADPAYWRAIHDEEVAMGPPCDVENGPHPDDLDWNPRSCLETADVLESQMYRDDWM